MDKLIIAIDGFSSCGKSTLAQAIAKKMGYIYIDTGAMYRSVTLYALQHGMYTGKTLDRKALINALPDIRIDFVLDPVSHVPVVRLNQQPVEHEIRSIEVSDLVSEVSSLPEVRERMMSLQRAMGRQRGIVMDGRDIGTVIFPDADIKLFMTADPEVRALRRLKELESKNIAGTLEEIRANISKRDHLDQTRATSPLIQAPDAIVLDNSQMTMEDELKWFDTLLKQKFA